MHFQLIPHLDHGTGVPTPLAALELGHTPTELHFVRDHFPVPAAMRPWSCVITAGERSSTLDLDGLKALPQRSLTVLLECAGHRRAEFDPVPAGLPWGAGAVSQASWKGVSLAAVLESVDIPSGAREVVLEGADAGPVAGAPGIHRFARSLPLDKALDGDVLLATEINGEPITARRGGPVRAIVPGWYATDAVKWLQRIWFTREFDGYFQAQDYRLRAPGEAGPGERMSALPIHALITTPSEEFAAAGAQVITGLAWGGDGGVDAVLVRVDLGPWLPARLGDALGPYAGVPFTLPVRLEPGRHELACRAIDRAGNAQPFRPAPNVCGYGNHAVHRVRLTAR